MDRKFAEGRIVLAGPYGDRGEALVIVEAESLREAEAFFDGDPWVDAELLFGARVVEWTIFLDSRKT